MPKVIIANVDSDSMCGNDMPPEVHALSSMCCCRLLVLAGDDDLVVLPHSVSDEFIAYVSELLDRRLSRDNVVVPRDGDTRQLILNDASLNDGHVAAQIRERAGGDLTGWRIEAYFLDRPVMTLADELGLPLHGVDDATDLACRDFLRCGGAETFNSKVLFRQLAGTVKAPVPAGLVASTPNELAVAVRTLIGETGRVIIKQDLNSGSAGNTVITRHGETTLTGASRVLNLPEGECDFAPLAEELWPQVALQRNTRVVVEAYHRAAQVYYSELWVPGVAGSPKLLNFGEMRMEPTFIGFEIPGQRMLPSDLGEMTAHSMNLAREAGRRGFVGYMNIDSIVTEDGRVFFNEVNGRMGCCTNVEYLARELVGDDYLRERVVLTYNWVSVRDFPAVVKALDEAGLAWDRATRTGVVVAIEDVARCGVIDYMVVGETAEHARELEQRALTAMRAA
ncbi:peptide ligase PGM1-related protein [Nonomuraea candida]|uniref:preATP grasp domain-containing protein n=1 Tax=Nonomuraea candida TaxID=359159 RepID=UPI0005B94D5E|nr:peptide ligase PGM1-related protein [Nonomuraea candida]